MIAAVGFSIGPAELERHVRIRRSSQSQSRRHMVPIHFSSTFHDTNGPIQAASKHIELNHANIRTISWISVISLGAKRAMIRSNQDWLEQRDPLHCTQGAYSG